MPRTVRVVLVPLALTLALPACRITPDEIQRIETENELLREQVQSMRLECEQYRKIEIGIDRPAGEPDTEPPGEPQTPAPR